MVFKANPLSLSIPDTVFDAWLRDNHFLEIIDDCSAAAAAAASTSASSSRRESVSATTSIPSTFISIARRLISSASTLISILTFNPFSKLTTDDLAGVTPAWTHSFLGDSGSFSWPFSPEQARMRVGENVKRYARNYASLSVLIFACSLYQMPVSLFGLISCLLLWELFRFCNTRWSLENHPHLRQFFIFVLQCATMGMLYCCNVQMALVYAVCISYAVMLLHAMLRKLTPTKHPPVREKYQWLLKTK